LDLDEHQINAVAARIELDLRTGAAFTRLQCRSLQPLAPQLQDAMISFGEPNRCCPSFTFHFMLKLSGSCQFPTLGFVVDRYFRVKNFIPETFWSLKIMHRRDNINVNFLWRRVRLFDRMIVTIIFERCLDAKLAKVGKVSKKPTSKWRPLPLTTVELQKNGTRFLRMTSKQVMDVAEKLYQKGFISYPRTETDQFAKEIDLKALVQKQAAGGAEWAAYAQR
jgi:DNA topoisomerase III